MIMMISKFYSKQKIFGVNDFLCGVNLGGLRGLHAMGVYWG